MLSKNGAATCLLHWERECGRFPYVLQLVEFLVPFLNKMASISFFFIFLFFALPSNAAFIQEHFCYPFQKRCAGIHWGSVNTQCRGQRTGKVVPLIYFSAFTVGTYRFLHCPLLKFTVTWVACLLLLLLHPNIRKLEENTFSLSS